MHVLLIGESQLEKRWRKGEPIKAEKNSQTANTGYNNYCLAPSLCSYFSTSHSMYIQMSMQLTDHECNALQAVIGGLQNEESGIKTILGTLRNEINNKIASQAFDEVEDLLESFDNAIDALHNIQAAIQRGQSKYHSSCGMSSLIQK